MGLRDCPLWLLDHSGWPTSSGLHVVALFFPSVRQQEPWTGWDRGRPKWPAATR